MEEERIIWGIVAIVGMLSPVVGIYIGLIRYRKNGEKVIQRVDEEYRNATEAGGIKSLYYKNKGRRIFKLTYGLPIAVGFIIGLALLCLAFYNLKV